jgi:hypothetical protein
MRRKRNAKEHSGPSETTPGVHRTAVAVLIGANLAAFAATLYVLRQLGQAETVISFAQPDIDFATLYEDNPPRINGFASDFDVSGFYKEEPSNIQLPAMAPPSPPSKTRELFQIPAGATVDPMIAETLEKIHRRAPSPQPAAPMPPHPISSIVIPPTVAPLVLSAQDRLEVQEAALACPPCSGKVRGPLPTTLHASWPNPSACQWEQHPRQFINDLTAGIEHRYDLQVAQEFCVELGDDCYGVTCEASATRCTARSGRELQTSHAGETSYVKVCGKTFYATAGRVGSLADAKAGKCEGGEATRETPPRDSEELQGAAIIILAHSRGDALKLCLDSLLMQKDIKLFKLFVSLDLQEAVPVMTEVVKKAEQQYNIEIKVWTVEKFVGDPSIHNKDQIAWFQFNAGKIAHHYWVAFERAFQTEQFKYAIFLEEDLVSAPDFIALFRSTAWLLEKDPSIWCIGAWNDIGMSAAFSDQCRLIRTSYFPGLGFLLTKSAWTRLREMWPTAPTMGWDYWMRVGFRKEGKECIIPEVPRSRHMIGTGGSSINNNKQFKLFRSMALAQTASTCDMNSKCRQFGDVSYLLEDKYAEWMSQAVKSLPTLPVEEIRIGATLDRSKTYVVPYIFEEYASIVEMVGLRPKGTKTAIPQDIRSEHYGMVHARHLQSRARILLVDKRSPLHYLPEAQQVRMNPNSMAVAAAKGLSCKQTCESKQMTCDNREMHFINNCRTLESLFGCEAGCAHQVGKELPVYVPDETQPTYRQCLVTFISPLRCETAHKSTARACACTSTSGR